MHRIKYLAFFTFLVGTLAACWFTHGKPIKTLLTLPSIFELKSIQSSSILASYC